MDKLTESEEICKQQEMTISSSNKRLEELQEIADDRHQQCVSYQRAIEVCTHWGSVSWNTKLLHMHERCKIQGYERLSSQDSAYYLNIELPNEDIIYISSY